MKSRWIEHSGKQVFLADFSDLGTDTLGLQDECRSIIHELLDKPEKSVFSITNVGGTVATAANLNTLKNLMSVTNKYVARRAVIGLDGSRKAFVDLVNRISGGTRFTTFNSLEKALDWIVQFE